MGTQLGVSLSGSSSATSGLEGSNLFGDFIVGGSKLNPWVLYAVIAGLFGLGLVWLLRRK